MHIERIPTIAKSPDDSVNTHSGAYIQIYPYFHPRVLQALSYLVNSERGHGVPSRILVGAKGTLARVGSGQLVSDFDLL